MSEANIHENPGGVSPARKEPHHLRRVLTIWAVLSIIGVAVWLVLAPLLQPVFASEVGVFDATTVLVFTALAIPVALFVWVFFAYSLIVFRVKERPAEDGVHLQPSPLLQIGWLGITGALCLFLIVWGLFGYYKETTTAASNALVVQVTGQQWLWSFSYPQYGVPSQGQPLTVLELPVNRPVVFQVTSKDVLHGFTVRALGIRIDANPGEVVTLPAMTPTRVGVYPIDCVEFCGLNHSYMRSTVSIVDASSFNNWIKSQGGHI